MKKTYLLNGLDCANCAAKMETAIGNISGVKSASVNFLTTKLIIEFEEGADADGIISQAEKIVRKIEPDVRIKKA